MKLQRKKQKQIRFLKDAYYRTLIKIMEEPSKPLKSFSQILHTTCHIIKGNLEMAVRYTAGSMFSLSTQNMHML